MDPFELLAARVKELGHPSILDYFEANPGVPYGVLYRRVTQPAENAGHRDIPFMCLCEAHRRAALKAGQVREFAKDTLVRTLREHLRSGWNRNRGAAEMRANAVGDWWLPSETTRPLCLQVWSALKSLNPPDDWCPESPADLFIQQAFDLGWPKVDH